MTPRRARSKPWDSLERLLLLVATHPAAAGGELRGLWMGLLLRATAPLLLARVGLPVPGRAALFQRSAADAELEAWLSTHAEGQRLLLESVAHLTAATPSPDAPHALGALFEGLEDFEVAELAGAHALESTRRRKHTGSFFTPAAVAEDVARAALGELSAVGRLHASDLRVCDPACGAGSFLVEAGRAICVRWRERAAALDAPFDELALRRWLATEVLIGVDTNPLALRMAELALWAFVADPELPASAIGGLHPGDALSGSGFTRPAFAAELAVGLDWPRTFGKSSRFDLVIGNPPWVAYAGRASQPLAPARRAFLSAHYRSFRGYPTLHALFVERALELAPQGVIALLVPSPLADLDGYRSTRRLVLSSHEPCEPLLEFGEDAFSRVTQPCFSLIARPRVTAPPADEPAERRFQLAERTRLAGTARAVEPPAVLARLFGEEPLPRDLFGEFGLQTTRAVSEHLLLRADAPEGAFTYPLLEGREVREFKVGKPRLFLRPDVELLRKARCRLRAQEDYRRVRFVVRQTAKAPIAALHVHGFPFRNTLLAGFEDPEFSPELVVGLLNSSLYRALHLARQRDARQSVFPQVKIAHLRSLPRPPAASAGDWHRVCALVREASAAPPSEHLRHALDHAVFALFGLDTAERGAVVRFLRERAPELASSPA